MLSIAARALSVAVLALGVSAMCVSSALATYPGRNGRIVISTSGGGRYMHQAFDLDLFDSQGRAQETVLRICSAPDRMEGPPNCYSAGAASLSPDGSKVALPIWEQSSADQPSALFTVPLGGGPTARSPITVTGPWLGIGWDADGTPRLLPRPTPSDSQQGTILNTATQADWSADGRLAFESGDPQNPALVNVYAGPAGGPFRQLTFRGGQAPSWSPHGRWIAFARRGGVYVVPSSGGEARRIVAPPSYNFFWHRSAAPTWSPDGKRIAFYRQRTINPEDPVHTLSLYSVNWKTRKLRRLSDSLFTDDAYEDGYIEGPLWQALPRR
jgi:hypothetical protein